MSTDRKSPVACFFSKKEIHLLWLGMIALAKEGLDKDSESQVVALIKRLENLSSQMTEESNT